MIIKSVRLKNIRSYTDCKIDFPEGSVLLCGDIGCGKSTILLSIDFALFGIRKGEISGSDLLRHGKNSGSVEVDFDVEGISVTIGRQLKREKSISQESGFISINGLYSELTPLELKARIIELLGYPKDMLKKNRPIFNYTVYTPQDQMKHILMYNEDRLSTLRKIFDIDKYGRTKENSRLLLSELRAIKRELDASIANLDRVLGEKIKLEESLREHNKQEMQLTAQLVNISKALDSKNKEFISVKNEYDQAVIARKLINEKILRLNSISNGIASYEKEHSAMQARMSSILKFLENLKITDEPHKDMTEQLNAMNKERDQLISLLSSLDTDFVKLKSVHDKGFCSVCMQKVSDPESFSSRINEIKNKYDETSLFIEDLNSKISNAKKSTEDAKRHSLEIERRKMHEVNLSELNSSILSLSERIKSNKDEKLRLENELSGLHLNMAETDKINEKLKIVERELVDIQAQKMNAERAKARIEQSIENLNERIEKLKNDAEEMQKLQQKISKLTEITNWIDSHFIPLCETIEKHVMIATHKEFNELFQKWFSVLMPEETITVRVDDQFSPIIEQNGFETSYSNLSGGEKTSVALAYRLALNRVINSFIDSIKTKDILILDEPTDGFSSEQIDRIRDVIEELNLKQIIVVSHEPKIDTFISNVIRIYKENHVSTLIES